MHCSTIFQFPAVLVPQVPEEGGVDHLYVSEVQVKNLVTGQMSVGRPEAKLSVSETDVQVYEMKVRLQDLEWSKGSLPG